jgi:Ca-activated chloride channel homolog
MRVGAGPLFACALGLAQTFSSVTDAVPIYATVHHGSGELVGGLGSGDFSVFDDGQRATIVQFTATPPPVDVLMLVDVSSSMRGSLSIARTEAIALAGAISPPDRVRLGVFSAIVRISPRFADSAEVVARQLPTDTGSNLTRLYDAAIESMDDLVSAADQNRRRVLLILSDGTDTASSHSAADVIDRARSTDAMIFAVGANGVDVVNSRTTARAPDPELRRIVEATGGGYFAPVDGGRAADVASHVADALHRQYLLGIRSAGDGRVHVLSVRASCAGCTVRARTSYASDRR